MKEGDLSDTPLQRDQLLRKSAERPCAVSWPLAVDLKLEHLRERADEADVPTSRKELLAAIVAACEFTDEELREIVLGYRRLRVRDVLPDQTNADVLIFKTRRPGPRTS